MYKIRYSKYDIRVKDGIMARAYGIKFWHGARNRDTGQRWRVEIWLGTVYYFVWFEKLRRYR
jgi:hypothetical protein